MIKMNRREFTKRLPLIAGLPMILSESRNEIPCPKRHLIVLGTSAAHLVAKYGEDLNFDSFTLIDGSMPDFCKVPAKFFQFIPPKTLYEEFGGKRFLKKVSLPLIPPDRDSVNYLDGLEGELIFFAGLGNATGTILYQSLAAFYQGRSSSIQMISTKPFDFEGKRRKDRADLAIRFASDREREPLSFDLEEIRKKYGNLSIRSAYQKAGEEIIRILNS